MDADKYFFNQRPSNQFLSTLVDYYFYIDASISELSLTQEAVIPFPRITFGYFFDHPFLVTNHTLNESRSFSKGFSRISTHKITVQPESNRVRIIGAHLRPFCLAYLTSQPIKTLPWLINSADFLLKGVHRFQQKIDQCQAPEQMFNEVERLFLDNLLVRDLSLVTKAVQLIDHSQGKIQVRELATQLGVSDRTIRNQFENNIGCSPKEYARLVKIKQVAFQMKQSQGSLTNIAHQNEYFDQAHFIHEMKNVTGKSPNKLKKEIPDFRFLQF